MPVRRLLILLFTLLVTAVPAFAQQADPNVNIIYPPPIYALSGNVNIVGTANAPGMTSYFLEFRQLIDARTPANVSVPWQPATLPSPVPVSGGLLGTWNTALTRDGLYELRLTVFLSGGQVTYARVAPLRIINNPPPFVATPTPAGPPAVIIVTATPSIIQPPQPQPTTVPENPMVTAALDANVRAGDSTLYAPVGALLQGQSAPILGISSTGSGWWLIQLSNGRRGWIAPSTVQATGNLANIPVMNPPQPTATPTPVATATPNLPDAMITNVRFDRTPKQGETFQVIVTVVNQSGVPLPGVSVACNFTPMNIFVNQFMISLMPFGQMDVPIAVTLNTGGGGNVTANCAVDVNNLVAEISESNNFFNLTFTLAAP